MASTPRIRHTSSGTKATVNWSDIDKTKFYVVGTGMYTALTAMLHPISVIKTRQQVLDRGGNSESFKLSSNNVRGLFRGLPIVLALAVPARVTYITVLEGAKEIIAKTLTKSGKSSDSRLSFLDDQLITSISNGAAGGLAAVTTQGFVVPMDIISQRQMITETPSRAVDLFRDIIRKEGLLGLYKGFSLSLLSSIPGGTVWWGTYGGMKHWIHESSSFRHEIRDENIFMACIIQVTSGITAAVSSALVTQPLDVLKVRLQVRDTTSSLAPKPSIYTVSKDLLSSNGISGLYRGLLPRIVHISLWGTILSSAYEYLKYSTKAVDKQEFLCIEEELR